MNNLLRLFTIKLNISLIFINLFLLMNGCKIHKKTTFKQPIEYLHESNFKNHKSLLADSIHQLHSFNTDTLRVLDLIENHIYFKNAIVPLNNQSKTTIDSAVVLNPNEIFNNVDGKVRDLRILFVYLGVGLFVLALLFLVFAIVQWHYIYLLGTAISSGVSYLLLKLGKKDLKGKHVLLDKKLIKQLKKWALRLFLVSLAVYLFLGLFY